MFSGCTSLTQAPALPATTLGQDCYWGMFGHCSSLTDAPSLPATTLVSGCYRRMFEYCTNLSSIDVAFTEWTPADITNATIDWVKGVQTTAGTFTKPAALSTEFSGSRIPTNWTVVDQ